jgi:uncharacterized protein (DUF952 family)
MSDFPIGATTLHLIPEEIWNRAANQSSYTPDAFAADGFVHCTDGDENLIAVGNRYYTGDPRPYLALTIAIDKLTSPVRYDDPGRIFPHIYGPINRAAVVSKRSVTRGSGGSFVAIADDETAL